jgi:hypothetical protein
MGEKIERATAIFGASAKDVQELQLANELAGGSADSFGRLIDRLQQSLQRAQVPTSQQALALQAIGLSASQLIGLPLPEQMDRRSRSSIRAAPALIRCARAPKTPARS